MNERRRIVLPTAAAKHVTVLPEKEQVTDQKALRGKNEENFGGER
jgi:hypothetical protein